MCPSSDFCYDARGAVQIAAPTRSNGFSPLSGSLDSAKFFAGSLTRPAKGASKGRTSGQLFSAASRVRVPRPTSLCSPGCGLSSAPTRGTRTRDGAELATSKAPTAAAPSPLKAGLELASASHVKSQTNDIEQNEAGTEPCDSIPPGPRNIGIHAIG